MNNPELMLMRLKARAKEILKSTDVIIIESQASTSSFVPGLYIRVSDEKLTTKFTIRLSGFYTNCGVCTCNSYNIHSKRDEKYVEDPVEWEENAKLARQLFDEVCKELYNTFNVGAIIAICYTAASGAETRYKYTQQKTLIRLGFVIESWFNNPQHVRLPTEGKHWISGVYIRKLDKFDVGLTKEEMNNLKSVM